ncbi:hypothetical protein [Paenibacillus typhae]|uniref:hypothetical protein n=1 Tax=Paenibacillus typhae TaxID=1174501 RepID=UPI001C8EA5E4|nr:hypothetical protein [Paenibacillus typhae]
MNTLSSMSRIFELASNYNVRFHELSSKPLAEYSLTLKKLEYKILDLDEGDILLNDLLTYFRKFRFMLSASPLPFSSHSELLSGKDLYRLSRQCQLMYPDLKDDIETLFGKFETLRTSPEKPVLDFLRGNFKDKLPTGLVLKTASDLNAIEEVLKRTFSWDKTFSVVTPSKLKKRFFFDRLIILGPTYWYPEYLFNCPRSPNIEIILYDWQVNHIPRMEYLTNSQSQISTLQHGCNIQMSNKSNADYRELIEVSDQIIDYKKVEKNLLERPDPGTKEYASAKLIGLANGKGIFFEDHSIRNIWTISLHSKEPLTKCSVNELDKDSYLLIRTGSGRDYVQIKADEFIGERASKMRYRHSVWKKRLRSCTVKYPTEKVCRHLRKYGGTRANKNNLKNWISDDNIKPREYHDFSAIMKLVKFEKYSEKLWKEAEELLRAHHRAGLLIRNLLIQEIKKSNLGKLELEQTMMFHLPDSEDASFTAYKIEYISQNVFRVEPDQLRSLIDFNYLGGR